MRIGVDLGGTKIEILALDARGKDCYRHRIATPQGDYPATISAITQLVLDAEAKLQQTATVGICIPGTLSPDNGLIKNANSTCLIGQPLDQDLQRSLKRPLRLANDADCLALSEACDGAAREADSVFGVILGTGVGGGIVYQGQLLSGPNGIAGEWGHNPLPWMDPQQDPALPCYCGKQGCIETYLSGPGFSQHHALVSGHPAIDAQQIMADVEAKQPQAMASFDRYCDRLARGLACVINMLDPDAIVLGGGLSNIASLYSEIPARWDAYVFSDRVNTRLVAAQHGDASGVRGAAWLWHNSPQP
ncbi:MAG: ROK family protein [Halopseudomonas sp.]